MQESKENAIKYYQLCTKCGNVDEVTLIIKSEHMPTEQEIKEAKARKQEAEKIEGSGAAKGEGKSLRPDSPEGAPAKAGAGPDTADSAAGAGSATNAKEGK